MDAFPSAGMDRSEVLAIIDSDAGGNSLDEGKTGGESNSEGDGMWSAGRRRMESEGDRVDAEIGVEDTGAGVSVFLLCAVQYESPLIGMARNRMNVVGHSIILSRNERWGCGNGVKQNGGEAVFGKVGNERK